MMKNWDANKRISWYIDKINKDSNPRDAIQYAELYGTIFRQIDDRHSVNYDFAKVFNDLVLFKFLKGNSNAIVPMSGYKGTEILCDLSAALKGSIGKINHGGSNSLSIFLL